MALSISSRRLALMKTDLAPFLCKTGLYCQKLSAAAVSSGVTIQAGMDTYILTSKARARLGDGQATRLYDVMEELGGGPVTLDQIVKQCEYRRYGSLLRTEPSIRHSVEWHLGNWLKSEIVKKTPTSL
jgi:hypothetical protein